MFIDREYFDMHMLRLSERFDQIDKLLVKPDNDDTIKVDGERLLDNYDVCKLLNISKRTLQRYRSSGQLPYQMIYHKTFYKESDVMQFIKQHFSAFMNKKENKS